MLYKHKKEYHSMEKRRHAKLLRRTKVLFGAQVTLHAK